MAQVVLAGLLARLVAVFLDRLKQALDGLVLVAVELGDLLRAALELEGARAVPLARGVGLDLVELLGGLEGRGEVVGVAVPIARVVVLGFDVGRGGGVVARDGMLELYVLYRLDGRAGSRAGGCVVRSAGRNNTMRREWRV